MINSLSVNNYALIKELSTEFSTGLNIITGQTGAGKSIILGAIGLLLGSRTDTSAIGNAGNKATAEALFTLPSNGEVADILHREEIDIFPLKDEHSKMELCVRREISDTGRSSAFINDNKVTLALLKEVGRHLVDIHSQHQTILLADNSYQLFLLDRIADNTELINRYNAAYSDFRKAISSYQTAKKDIEQTVADRDYLAYQLEEIDRLEINPAEWQDYEPEILKLEASAVKAEAIGSAMGILSSGNTSITDILESAIESLEGLDESGNIEVTRCTTKLEQAKRLITSVTDILGNMAEETDSDPEHLQRLLRTRSEINALLAKHNLNSADDLATLGERLRQRLADAESAPLLLAELEKNARRAKKEAMTLARELSANRQQAAKNLRVKLLEKARPLGMDNLDFSIEISQGILQPTGIDTVEFLFSFNKNQPLMALRQGASGGEMSRLMLAVKSVLANIVDLPTMVLDEIDTGVSGEVATKMARLMKETSKACQVIAITHLPRVAAAGDRHFQVFKADTEDATQTRITLLTPKERITAIACMLDGDNPSEAAVSTARQFLDSNKTH